MPICFSFVSYIANRFVLYRCSVSLILMRMHKFKNANVIYLNCLSVIRNKKYVEIFSYFIEKTDVLQRHIMTFVDS